MDWLRNSLERIQELGPLAAIQEWLLPFIQQLTEFTAEIPLLLQILVTAVWSAIPFIESDLGVAIAILVGVPTIPALIAAILGNWVAVMLVIIFTDKIRAWLRRHKSEEDKENKRYKKVRNAMQKYGVPGASLLGPILIGTHLNAFFMAAAGASRRNLMIWSTISIVVWGIVFAIIMHFTIAAIQG